MQAAKIEPKKLYAIKVGERLARFRVDAVVSRRFGVGPSGTRSSVEGQIVAEGDPRAPAETLRLEPDKILGEYTAYAELVEREAAEKAAKAAEAARHLEQREELRRLLYFATNLPMPEDSSDWQQPFHVNAGGVEIRAKGIEPMIAMLRDWAAVEEA